MRSAKSKRPTHAHAAGRMLVQLAIVIVAGLAVSGGLVVAVMGASQL